MKCKKKSSICDNRSMIQEKTICRQITLPECPVCHNDNIKFVRFVG
jgi:hypothetical protein